MKTYLERLREISDAAERQVTECMEDFLEDTLLDEGIEVEFNSDMNGIVGYTVRAFIDGSMYCSDEEGHDLEELKECYNAMMTFDEMTPYGNCLLADGLMGGSYAKDYEAVYNEAMKYLRSMPNDEVVRLKEPIRLSSVVQYDPWVDDFEYERCTNKEAYLEDDGFELLEQFLYEDLALLADKVKEVRKPHFDYQRHVNTNALYICLYVLHRYQDDDFAAKFLRHEIQGDEYDMAPDYIKAWAREFTDRESGMWMQGQRWNEDGQPDYESTIDEFIYNKLNKKGE